VAEDAFAGETLAVEDAFAGAAFAEGAFALDVEEAESEAEAGVDAGEGRPRLSAAKADDPNGNPKTANNMAATATLTISPLE
jgi:hypothetical protein